MENITFDKIEELTNRAQFWKDDADVSDGAHVLDTPPGNWIMSGIAIGAGVMTRECLMTLWKKTTGKNPPENPAALDVSWTDAAIWAATVGATIGVARALARRTTTAAVQSYYRQ